MLGVGLSCLIAGSVLLLLQVIWALRFAARYANVPAGGKCADRLPSVSVFLCVRGGDPSLAGCLNGLLEQDYPNYDIHVVIDNSHDPAWNIIAPIVQRADPKKLQVQVLENRRRTCSLKLSSLVQAIAGMDKSTEVVVLIDADVIPYRRWLQDLVQPLADPGVAATTGVRWYVPRERNSWGTMVRSLWNAAACAQMYAFNIPWGGSMALRADLFRKFGLLEQWAHSFVEDSGCNRFVRGLGLRLVYVPAATMVNHETIGFPDACRFIRRQLVCPRMCDESWPGLVAIGLGTPLAIAGVLAAAWAGGEGALLAGLAGTLAVYAIGMAIALSWTDRQINKQAQQRGLPPYQYCWKSLLALPLAQGVYLATLASALFLRRIEWRGIVYELKKKKRVRLLEYQPYRRAARLSEPETSLI